MRPMTELIIDNRTGEITDPDEYQPLAGLDIYAGGLTEDDQRLDAIATISAGYRAAGTGDRPGLPQRSQDGTIHVHYSEKSQRKPTGLLAALERTGGKRLTIAFPFDNPAAFVQQRFVRYATTRADIYGDQDSVTVVTDQGRRTVTPDDGEWEALIRQCKVEVSVYFGLAEWDEHNNARMIWPDGAAFYRLRFTSRNSLRNLQAALRAVVSRTGGRLAGLPFDLALDYRDVSGPDGKRYTVPTWTFTLNPPTPLSSVSWRQVVSGALAQASNLTLPPPRPETFDTVLLEGPEADLDVVPPPDELPPVTDAEVLQIAQGGAVDVEHYRRAYFAVARGTEFATDAGRAAFVAAYSHERFTSLTELLGTLSTQEAEAMITTLGELAAGIDTEPEPEPAPDPEPEPEPAPEPVPEGRAASTVLAQITALLGSLGIDKTDILAEIGLPATTKTISQAQAEILLQLLQNKQARALAAAKE